MAQFNRGDALWFVVPFPPMYSTSAHAITREPAPLPYFKRVQPGDVGYIRRGCFNLLFSAGCPLDGREPGVDVPQTFKQLDVGTILNAQPRLPGCTSTKTVREILGQGRGRMYPYVRSITSVSSRTSDVCSSLLEPGSSILLQLAGNQGAALLTKYPTYREDAQRERTFEGYTKEHYDSWVAFARERGHPNDVKPVLVTGVDMTRDFAMLTYSNDDGYLRAQFTASDLGVFSPWGTWDTPGVIENCGPQLCRPPSDPTHMGTVSDKYDQCVFVRYYTMRRRLGIPRVIRAAAGPHDLGPRGRDDAESPFGVECNSDTSSDIASSLFDDGRDDDMSSITSTDSESDAVVHNTTPVIFSPPFLDPPHILIDH